MSYKKRVPLIFETIGSGLVEINSPYCWELQYWCCAIRVSNLTFNLFHIFCCLLLPLTILWYYHCQLIQEKKKRKRELQKLGRKGKDKKERTLLTDFYLIYKNWFYCWWIVTVVAFVCLFNTYSVQVYAVMRIGW